MTMNGTDSCAVDGDRVSSFPLTYLRLRFECRAETRVQLGGLRAGSNLRGALLDVMRRAVCADPGSNDPRHVAQCPVCWLVAANEHPGVERRGYTLVPPLGAAVSVEADAQFAFHITLFGDAVRFLPYFVLAVPEVGRIGVGPGRGRFALSSIWAERPGADDFAVLAVGEKVVHPPDRTVGQTEIYQAAEALAGQIHGRQPRLRIDFRTPLRLIQDERLLKSSDFGVIFARLLERVDRLAVQYAGAAPREETSRLQLEALANQVRLVETHTSWVEVPSGSSRTGQQTWISGLVGPAWYSASAETWCALLPWLLWGQAAQVGKDTAKGNGVFEIAFV
jgi:hypothetical protein